jgi:hypothetical protein
MILVDTNAAEDFLFAGLGGGTAKCPHVVRQRQDLGDVVVVGRGRRLVLERKEIGGESLQAQVARSKRRAATTSRERECCRLRFISILFFYKKNISNKSSVASRRFWLCACTMVRWCAFFASSKTSRGPSRTAGTGNKRRA